MTIIVSLTLQLLVVTGERIALDVGGGGGSHHWTVYVWCYICGGM